jgi:predicted O-linked N-acetylglucosamine transferase (SPINDLY family)
LNPKDIQAMSLKQTLLQQAIKLHQDGKILDAEKIYITTIKSEPKNFEALHYLGVIKYQQGSYQESIRLIKKAISIKPDYAEAYGNIAMSYKSLQQFDLAIDSLNKAIEIKPRSYSCFYNLGNLNKEIHQYLTAIKYFTMAIELDPNRHEAYFNRGVCHSQLNDIEETKCDYLEAIKIKPDFKEAYKNLSQLYVKEKKNAEAFEILYKLLEIDPDDIISLQMIAELFKDIGKKEHTLSCYKKIIEINPSEFFAEGYIFHLKLFLSDWSEYYEDLKSLEEGLSKFKPVAAPFVGMTAIDDPLLQLASAKSFCKVKGYISTSEELIVAKNNEKIRIGYYSADFYNHATSYLMAELFELHNKDIFEIHGFSTGQKVDDEMSKRIQQSFSKFHEVSSLNNEQIINLSKEVNIDIAIDLKGHTKDGRPSMFAKRLAPIQVNYLGFPGTTGIKNIDYIVADSVIVPEINQKFYSEKIAYLPNCYQVNDSKRKISEYTFTREELGLPKNAFIFCSFNYVYKINPEVFDSWAKILKQVPDSVLWLMFDNDISSNNLLNEAKKRGVNPDRIIFANRMDLPLHLARHRLADLFLDTWPCNAHTTASDALWTELPIVTKIGQSFASRVCASLLSAIGVPELITTTTDEYETLAIDLAMNRDKLNGLKEKLIAGKLHSPLFDTTNYVVDLENIYMLMYKNYQAKLPPDHIYIDQ